MNPNEKFKLAVIGLCSFLVSMLLLWIFFLNGVVPMIEIRPMRPSADLPKFRTAEDREAIDQAWESGAFEEDTDVKILRNQVLSSLEEYKNAPCDKEKKENYVDALVGFVEDRMDRMSSQRYPEDSSEVKEVNGTVFDSSLKFDAPIMDEIIASAANGYISKKDIPSKMSILIRAGIDQAGGEENITPACDK